MELRTAGFGPRSVLVTVANEGEGNLTVGLEEVENVPLVRLSTEPVDCMACLRPVDVEFLSGP
jgi:hypothetical protein